MARSDVVVRVASAPGDLAGIDKIDRAYATDRIYRVRRSELGFWLEEERADPPMRKTYLQPAPELSDRLLVATIGGEIVGCGELRFDSWSQRTEIEHLTVSGDVRRQGVGACLSGRWTSAPAGSLPPGACGWRPRTSTTRRSSSTGAWGSGCAGWMRRCTGPTSRACCRERWRSTSPVT